MPGLSIQQSKNKRFAVKLYSLVLGVYSLEQDAVARRNKVAEENK